MPAKNGMTRLLRRLAALLAAHNSKAFDFVAPIMDWPTPPDQRAEAQHGPHEET